MLEVKTDIEEQSTPVRNTGGCTGSGNTHIKYKNEYIQLFIDIMKAPNDEIKVLKMEKYLETQYYLLADLFIFSYNLLHKQTISISRFERILKNVKFI